MLKELQFLPVTDEIRESVEKFWYSKYSKPADNFDKYGTKFSISELQHIGLNLIFLPVEFMATYADKNCIDKANDENFIQSSFGKGQINKYMYSELNTTSIGNLAYLYMHCPNEKIKQKCKKDIENIFDWYLESVKANLN